MSRWARFFRRRERMMEDLDQEIRDFIERETQDNIARGMWPEEAHYAALRKFGNVTQIKEETWEVWSFVWLEQLWQDIRFGLRMLAKNPGFTVVAVLTLALGIGANTAIFSVVDSVLLAPLQYGQPHQLVVVWESDPRFKHPQTDSYPNFRDWQSSARSFQQMAALYWRGHDLAGHGTPVHVDGREISSGFFTTLGVELTLGRDFTPQEDQRGGAPAVIISNRLWIDYFAGSREALGKTVTLDGVDYAIVGVLPARFQFFGNPDVYTPLGQADPVILNDRAGHSGLVIARLKAEASLAQAQAEMSAIQGRLDRLYPDADRGLEADVVPLKQQIVGDVGKTLLLLLGAVGLVLLIACANVANLLLARSATRVREFAIRASLGASRARVVRQLLTESVLLSLGGGGLGLLIAVWGIKPVLAAVPGSLPRSEDVGLSLPVLLFALAAAVTVGVLFGLAPALKNSKSNLQETLKEGGRTLSGSRHHAQKGLVIVQISLTLVLLVGAGLLFRTIRNLWEANPGFDTKHLITFEVGVSSSLTRTPTSTRIAYQQLLERIQMIPGVEGANFTMLVPLTHKDVEAHFWVGAQKPVLIQEAPQTLLFLTSPDYLRTMGIPLLRGRFFTAEDTSKSPSVTVIDSDFAQAYFPGRDPVGQTLTFDAVGTCRIIGVVGHVTHWGLGETNPNTRIQSYFPLYQLSDEWVPKVYSETTMVIRTPLAPAAVLPAIREAVYGVGKDQPVYNVKTMPEIVSESMASQRFPMILLGAFAGLALLLASVGIYGVVSYSVGQRVHEIGIRMAMGAERSDVLKLVVGHGFKLALAGISIGVAGGLALTRFLSSLLYGVKPTDPLTFVAVSLLLSVVALLACYIPARRATKVDPMVALRYE